MKKTLLKVLISTIAAFLAMIMLVDPTEGKAAGKLPAPVADISNVTSKSVTIEWELVSGADGYVVYKYNSKKKKYKKIYTFDNAQTVGCDVTGLKPNKTYKFKVAAFVLKAGKRVVQTRSKVVKIRTLADSGIPDDFYVYDKSGKIVHLSDFAGGPIIVNIWAKWCGPCVGEMPHFEKYYKKYGDKVKFMMINCEDEDSMDDVNKFLKEKGYTFPVYYDFDYSANQTYGNGYIPMTIVFTKDGKIIYHDAGSLEESQLEKLIKDAMK